MVIETSYRLEGLGIEYCRDQHPAPRPLREGWGGWGGGWGGGGGGVVGLRIYQHPDTYDGATHALARRNAHMYGQYLGCSRRLLWRLPSRI
jgi:hypothetical protein